MASFVHLFSQQKNGLGIFLNVLRIGGVGRFQVGKWRSFLYKFLVVETWLWRPEYCSSYLSVMMVFLNDGSLSRCFKWPIRHTRNAKSVVHHSGLQYCCPYFPWIILSHSPNRNILSNRHKYFTIEWLFL